MAVTCDVDGGSVRAMSAKQLSAVLTLVDEHARSHTDMASRTALLAFSADLTRTWLEGWT